MNLYERFAATVRGAHALAAARLRHEVLSVLHQALHLSGLTQSDVAEKLGIRRSAVNQVFRGDGNLRVNTIADYLHAMGFELDVRLTPAGEPRQAALEQREVRPAVPDWRVRAPRPLYSDALTPCVRTETPARVLWESTTEIPVNPTAGQSASLELRMVS